MSTQSSLYPRLLLVVALAAAWIMSVNASSAASIQDSIARYATEARSEDSSFDAFSAERGHVLFSSRPATGKPDTPSCTSCHSDNPAGGGQTRAGKEIAPMALAKTPGRYSDVKKLKKWFRRNCKSVLGRVCTSLEKGDFLTFMATQ